MRSSALRGPWTATIDTRCSTRTKGARRPWPRRPATSRAPALPGFVGGQPPRVDLAAERRLADYLVAGAERGLFRSAHDCSQGGLGVALAEVAMGGPYDETGVGLDIDLTAYGLRLAADELLFSESHGRAVVTCPPERATAALALAQELGVPAHRVGTVAERGGAVRLRLRDAIVEHPVERLRQANFSRLSP